MCLVAVCCDILLVYKVCKAVRIDVLDNLTRTQGTGNGCGAH